MARFQVCYVSHQAVVTVYDPPPDDTQTLKRLGLERYVNALTDQVYWSGLFTAAVKDAFRQGDLAHIRYVD